MHHKIIQVRKRLMGGNIVVMHNRRIQTGSLVHKAKLNQNNNMVSGGSLQSIVKPLQNLNFSNNRKNKNITFSY